MSTIGPDWGNHGNMYSVGFQTIMFGEDLEARWLTSGYFQRTWVCTYCNSCSSDLHGHLCAHTHTDACYTDTQLKTYIFKNCWVSSTSRIKSTQWSSQCAVGWCWGRGPFRSHSERLSRNSEIVLFSKSLCDFCLNGVFLRIPSCPGTHYVDQADLELTKIHPPLPSSRWD